MTCREGHAADPPPRDELRQNRLGVQMSKIARIGTLTGAALAALMIAPSPASAHVLDCSHGYGTIQEYLGGYFKIGGKVECYGSSPAPERLSIYCLLDHRHSFYWEGHDSTKTAKYDGIYVFSMSIATGTNGNHYGTNGDKYRTRCTGTATHGTTSSWNVYSSEQTLG